MANQHVVPNNGQWQVKRENAERATKTFNTQKEAIEYGKEIAIRQQSELIIHDHHGRIRGKDSYGNDPCPPKDATAISAMIASIRSISMAPKDTGSMLRSQGTCPYGCVAFRYPAIFFIQIQ